MKSKLALVLGLVELLTLGTAGMLYLGARRFENDAGLMREANRDLRDLLALSLSAHAYMDAFGRSLSQRNPDAERERRDAAAAFESRVQRTPTERPSSSSLEGKSWRELQSIAGDLSTGLRATDALREQNDPRAAELRFDEVRKGVFAGRMLPWLSTAIGTLSNGANAREAEALRTASHLRIAGAVVACASPLFALFAVLWVLDALAATQASLVEKNERLEEAYQLQGEFVSNVTHELRSPLHSIRGYLEFVLEDEPGLSEQSKKHLCSIGDGAKRLLRLVNDILDFSKLEARQLQIQTSRFELNPLLEEALFDARALIAGRPVELVLEAPEGPLFLDSDYTRLRQILTNLLSNAVKFTERGRVTLHVDVHPERVELSVRDTGLGIPEAQLEVIFEPFKQVTPVNGGKAKGGTGLGLAIVARLAALIEASIRVKSELGKGSEFTVVMPRRTLVLS